MQSPGFMSVNQSAPAMNALRRQLERDSLAELVGELIDEVGPLDNGHAARQAEEPR